MNLSLKLAGMSIGVLLFTGLVGACFAAPAMAQTIVDAARAALPAKTREAGVLNVATSY